MKFKVKKNRENIVRIARQIGYVPISATEWKGFHMMRSVSGREYPRFHIYVEEEGDFFIFNIHLDQKKPSYSSGHAHGGEYEGEIVEEEIARIWQMLPNAEGQNPNP